MDVYHRDPLHADDGDDVYYDAQYADDDVLFDDQNRTDMLKLILYDLNSAIAPRDLRLMAIHAALEEFDHDDELLHDEELELRADHILLQKLTYAMSVDASSIEVGHICSTLEAVYRGGRTRLAQSFHEICDALLPLFVEMVRPPPGYNPTIMQQQQRESMETKGLEAERGTNASNAMDYENNDAKRYMPPSEQRSEMMQENISAQQSYYGDYDDDESAESVEIPSAYPREYFEQRNKSASASAGTDAAAADEMHEVDQSERESIPPGTGDYLDELTRRISGGEGGGTAGFNTTYSTAASAHQQQHQPNDMNTIVPRLSFVSENDLQQALVLHHTSINSNTAAGADDFRLYSASPPGTSSMFGQPAATGAVGEGQGDGTNDTIRMELEDAKQAMMNMPESVPTPASHGFGYYPKMSKRLTTVSMSTEQFDNRTPNYLGIEEEDGVMALRGGGKDDENDEEDDDDTMPNVFDPSQFQSEFNDFVRRTSANTGSEYEDSQDNPFSDISSHHGTGTSSFRGSGTSSSSFKNSFQGYGGGSSSSVGASSVRSNGGGEQQWGSASLTSSYKSYIGSAYNEESKSNVVTEDQYEAGADNMSTHNPFSDSSSYRDYGGGGSSVFSGSVGGGGGGHGMMGRNDNDYRFPKIDEHSESGGDGNNFNYQGGFNNDFAHDDESGSGGQAAPEFDEQGGYSGSAPAVFAGYGDEVDSYVKTKMDGDQSQTSAGYARSGGTTSYGDSSGGSEYHEADQGQEAGEYSSAQGYEGYSRNYSEMFFSDDQNARRHSEVTDDWGGQGEGAMESGGLMGAREQFTDGTNKLYMSQMTDFTPVPGFTPELERDQYYSEPVSSMGQFQTYEEEKQEAEYPNSSEKNLRDGIVGQDEDIFQFQEPRISMTSQDYFNYSDPVEGEICPLAVRKVLKILRYFSRVLSAMEPLAQQTGLVDACLYHMTKKPRSVDYDEEIASRVDAIAVVVNLACAEENKIMLVYHPGLLDAVINISNHDPIDEAREHAAIVLMNLAYAEENKVHMVNQDHLLDTLVHLLSDVSPFTRRYASAALFTLACTYANTAVMARHCNGGILEALRKVLLNDPIDEARVNAAEALFNMARNNSDDTVENMGNHPRLLASLSHSVLTDYSADVRAYSARALEWLSADIHYPMPCHRILLKALTTASQWTKTTCIAEALKMQASLSENRKPMVEQPGLLDALATLSLLDGVTDDEVKTCAISAIERLSKEASTRHIMVQNEGVMTALTKATFAKDGAEDDAPDEGTPTALLMKTALKNLSAHL